MLQEGSVAHVEALGWATQPSERPQRHDQAQASTPGRRRRFLACSWGPHPPLHQPSLLHPSGPVLSRRPGGLSLSPGAPLLSPHSGRDDFSSKEGAEDASSLGGEEAKHREGGDGGLVQIWRTERENVKGGGVIMLSPSPGNISLAL